MADNISRIFIEQISDLIEGLIKKSNIPTIKSCKIIVNNGNGTYKVKRGNEEHNVIGKGTYSIDSVVQVILPDGKWTRAMILTPPLSSSSGGGSEDYSEVIKSIAKINENIGNISNLPYSKINIIDSLNAHDKDNDKHVSESDRVAINNTASHIANENNPHKVTKEQLGLGNVENKSSNEILKELSKNMVTDLLGTEYTETIKNNHTHENKTILDKITDTLINKWNSAVEHITNKNNPHEVNKEQVGLGNVPNVNTNDQIPIFLKSETLENIVSGDRLSTLFSKISKAISEFILHKDNKGIHVSKEEKNNWNDANDKKHTHENKNIIDKVTQPMVDVLEEILEEGFKIDVDDALSTESINPVQNKVITTALNDKAEKNHEHNYAGSDISGGSANSAKKLETPRKINGVDFDGTKDIRVTDEVIKVTKEEYEQMLNDGTLNENAYYLTTNDETNNLIANINGFFTLAIDGWDLVAYYSDESGTTPPITFDPETWNLYYEVPDE